jgi:replicative DNA helicase
LDEPTNAELLLISAVIQTGTLAEAAEVPITGEYFHSHRPEWEFLADFVARYRKVPDKATFRAQFPEFPLLKTTDIAHACDMVVAAHIRYQLTTTMREVVPELIHGDPLEAMALMHSTMTDINHQTGSKETHADALRAFSPILEEAKRRVDNVNRLGYAGLSFGFPTLNNRTGGMHPGDLCIWAARLGQGKTWFLCKVAAENLLSGKRVVFVSLEQPRAQIIFRIHVLLAQALGYSIRHRDLMQGTNLDLDYYREFLVDLGGQVPGQLIVSDPSRGRASPYTLASLMDRHQPDLMILDYLTLMQTTSDEWQGVAKLSKDTKLVAAQYGVPILAAAQINREGESSGKRPPRSKNLSQSDAIGQDADIIVTHRQDSVSVVQGLLDKNRSGQSGQVFWSSFFPNEGRINEISADEALTLKSQDMIDDEGY